MAPCMQGEGDSVAVQPVSSEPVSGRDSLFNRERTGISGVFGGFQAAGSAGKVSSLSRLWQNSAAREQGFCQT
jgi:hypothetical protein